MLCEAVCWLRRQAVLWGSCGCVCAGERGGAGPRSLPRCAQNNACQICSSRTSMHMPGAQMRTVSSSSGLVVTPLHPPPPPCAPHTAGCCHQPRPGPSQGRHILQRKWVQCIPQSFPLPPVTLLSARASLPPLNIFRTSVSGPFPPEGYPAAAEHMKNTTD